MPAMDTTRARVETEVGLSFLSLAPHGREGDVKASRGQGECDTNTSVVIGCYFRGISCLVIFPLDFSKYLQAVPAPLYCWVGFCT